jgi:clusterin-associated protein 1
LKAVENEVSESINALERHQQHMITTIDNLSSDQTNLEIKIEKKKEELGRAQNRLKSLQGVRPAYMDEYEKQEIDLIRLYQVYVERFRNLAFLEQQLDEHVKTEMEAALVSDFF